MTQRFFLFVFITFSIIISSCKSTRKAEKPTDPVTKSKLSEKQQIDFSFNFFNASKEKNLGNIEMAISLYEKCLNIDPTNAAAIYELANIYSYQGKYKLAIPYAKRAVSLEPENEWYSLLLAECLIKTNNFSEAIKVYQHLIKTYPGRLDFYEDLAAVQLYAGKIDDAIKTYDKLEKLLGGLNESVSFQKLNIYKQLGQDEKMLTELNKLILAFPTEGKYYGMLGEYYMGKGQKDKALEAYKKLQEIDPGNGFVHLSMAEYYRSENEDEKSFGEMKLAFRSESIDIDSKIKILLSYYYNIPEAIPQRKEQGLDLCSILTEVYPSDAKSFSVYGDFLYRDKKIKEARKEYRSAIALDKERYLLWSQLLIIESELSDYDAMYKESTEALELFPMQPFPYLLKGLAAMQLNKDTQAVELLTSGITYVVDNKPLLGQFYSSLGDAHNKLKDHKASDEAYEKALSIDSNNVFVLNNYAYYLSLRREKLETAEKMSKYSNDLAPNNDSYQDTYAWILYQLKKYEEAKSWIEKALENGGKNSAVIIEHYGDIVWQLGDKSKAVELWNEAKQKGTGSEFLEKKVADKTLYE